MNLGGVIREIRKERFPGLTIAEFGKLVGFKGVSGVYLSQIELNRSKPSLEMLEYIGEALKVPAPVLLYRAMEEKDIPQPKRLAYYKTIKPVLDTIVNEMFFDK